MRADGTSGRGTEFSTEKSDSNGSDLPNGTVDARKNGQSVGPTFFSNSMRMSLIGYDQAAMYMGMPRPPRSMRRHIGRGFGKLLACDP